MALAVAGLAAAATPAATLPADEVPVDSLAQRLKPCTACHGKEGRSTSAGYFPRIAGKPAGYLFNQLAGFRDGRRNNAAMTYLVDTLSDDYLREIAGYFAALELPYEPVQPYAASPAVLARGAALVERGDASRALPACTACHGERMTGVQPAIPGLLGLPRDYLVAQLGAWRNGLRRAVEPDCMATVARRLDADDIPAVATWLAAQTPPQDARPAGEQRRPLPIDCGRGQP